MIEAQQQLQAGLIMNVCMTIICACNHQMQVQKNHSRRNPRDIFLQIRIKYACTIWKSVWKL